MSNNILSASLGMQHCTGCSVCGVSCPQKAITTELTKNGFYEPHVDETLCTACGLCKKICYKFDGNILCSNESTAQVYSAVHKNSYELKTSTSGGVSAELMREAIRHGYRVLGVAYEYRKNVAATKVASVEKDIEQFKGSKYFQSYTVDAFIKALKDTSGQKYAIFGTPCQIYAIHKYAELHAKKDKFLLIDVFCHGCTSVNLWIKYLRYSKEAFGVSEFDKIEFRSKAYAWHEFCFTFQKSNISYNSKRINDPFYTIFFDKNAFNLACYDCKMRSSLAYTDIRLGDFWGPLYDTDTAGVSAVVLCTDKGKQLFENVKREFITHEHTLEEVIGAQSYGKQHYYDDALREYTLELLSSDLSMTEVMKAYKKTYSWQKKIKVAAKNALKYMPQSIYFTLKRVMHSI